MMPIRCDVSVAFRQLRVYVRLAVIVLVALAIGLVLFKNRAHRVEFWFFGLTDTARPINVIFLMVCTAAGTLATWWTLRLARGIWRDLREVERARDIDQANRVLHKRATELEERERRIDAKLQDAIGEKREGGDE